MITVLNLFPYNWRYWFLAIAVHVLIWLAWHSDDLFGKRYAKLMGSQYKKVKITSNLVTIMLFLAAIYTSVLLCFLKFVGATMIQEGINVAFYLWLGFIVTTGFYNVLLYKKSFELYLINIGYHLVALAATAGILIYGGL